MATFSIIQHRRGARLSYTVAQPGTQKNWQGGERHCASNRHWVRLIGPAELIEVIAAGASLLLSLAILFVLIGLKPIVTPVLAKPSIEANRALPPKPKTDFNQNTQPLSANQGKGLLTPRLGDGDSLMGLPQLWLPQGGTIFPDPAAPSLGLLAPATAKTRVLAPKTSAPPRAKAQKLHFALYLGNFPSEALAREGWLILQGRHQTALADLSPMVRMARSKQGEAVYRLFAGPLPSRVESTRRCASISSATINCTPADLSQPSAEAARVWD